MARPRNIGKATTSGIELEAKFRADEWWEGALPVSLRSNLSLFTSKVDGIPGPHNQIDAQPKGHAQPRGRLPAALHPLTLGASVNFTPSSVIQQSLLTEVETDRKRVFDAFALWNVDSALSVRLSANNLAPLDYLSGSVITTGDQLISSRAAVAQLHGLAAAGRVQALTELARRAGARASAGAGSVRRLEFPHGRAHFAPALFGWRGL